MTVMHIEPGHAALLDVVGARGAFPVAMQAAAAQAGATSLTAWASPAVLDALQGTDRHVTGFASHLAVAKASDLTAVAVAAAPWWWMGGDTVFL